MNVIQKLFRKDAQRGQENYEDINGWLTKEDIQKLRSATVPKRSEHRKDTYTIWECRDCSHSYYYKTLRCPLCSSESVAETVHPAHRMSPGIFQGDL